MRNIPNTQWGFFTILNCCPSLVKRHAEEAGGVLARRARDGLGLPVLSMGMSHDLDTAIAAGSTMVRVGTAIFGQRSYPAP